MADSLCGRPDEGAALGSMMLAEALTRRWRFCLLPSGDSASVSTGALRANSLTNPPDITPCMPLDGAGSRSCSQAWACASAGLGLLPTRPRDADLPGAASSAWCRCGCWHCPHATPATAAFHARRQRLAASGGVVSAGHLALCHPICRWLTPAVTPNYMSSVWILRPWWQALLGHGARRRAHRPTAVQAPLVLMAVLAGWRR